MEVAPAWFVVGRKLERWSQHDLRMIKLLFNCKTKDVAVSNEAKFESQKPASVWQPMPPRRAFPLWDITSDAREIAGAGRHFSCVARESKDENEDGGDDGGDGKGVGIGAVASDCLLCGHEGGTLRASAVVVQIRIVKARMNRSMTGRNARDCISRCFCAHAKWFCIARIKTFHPCFAFARGWNATRGGASFKREGSKTFCKTDFGFRNDTARESQEVSGILGIQTWWLFF